MVLYDMVWYDMSVSGHGVGAIISECVRIIVCFLKESMYPLWVKIQRPGAVNARLVVMSKLVWCGMV